MNKSIAIIVFLFTTIAQSQSIRTFVDTTSVVIGKAAHLHIQIQKESPNDRFSFQEYLPQDSISPHLEILSVEVDTIIINNIRTYELIVGFTGWDKGQYEVNPQPIFLDNDTIYTKAFSVQITEPKEPKDLHDIKDIIYSPRPWWKKVLDWWPLFIAIIAAIFIFYYVRVQRKKQKEEAEIVPISHQSLNEQTIQKLKKLREKQMIQKGEVKEFYNEYSSILKDFFGQRFHLPAKELFTSDLLYEIERKRLLSDENVRRLKTLLRRSDLAKFAKIKPSLEQSEQDLDQAMEIINNIPVQSITEYD